MSNTKDELGHEYRTILADLYIAAHNGAKAEPLLDETGAKLQALIARKTQEARIEATTIMPAVQMAMIVAKAQIERGESVTPNIAAAMFLQLEEIQALAKQGDIHE